MAQIPFSPPQVQAALQNPTRFPDQKLQQYARGQQPTGQVSPMMAQQEMATRNQERQAFQRQQAMQNNPENSPTVFQQKDMQLQQAMQALQQKEQQLGLAGAMLAKKQQDLAAREQGIAALPVNPNMFTAMDGGIVFRGGGRVEGYASDGLVQNRSILTNEGLVADFKRLFNYLGVPWTSFEEGMARTKEGQEALRKRVESFSEVPLTGSRAEAPSTAPREEPAKAKSTSPASGQRAQTTTTPTADYGTRYMRMMAPYRGESEEQQGLASNIQSSIQREIAAINNSQLSEKDKADARKKVIDEMTAEYGEYTKGREARRGDIAESLRGKPADIWQGIAAGLPTETRGVRLAGLMAGLAKGVAGERGRADEREREARMFLAKAAEEDARADLAERRGQRKEADAAELRAQQLRNEAADRMSRVERTGREGIAALLSRADKRAEDETRMAGKAAELTLGFEMELAKLREQAGLRPQDATTLALNWLAGGTPEQKKAAEMFVNRGASGRGEMSEGQIAKAMQEFNDPLKGPELRKQYGSVENYLAAIRATRAGIGQETSKSNGELVYDTNRRLISQ